MITVDLPGHVVNNRGEVGGSVQTHRLETLVISLHHPLDAAAVWVLWVSILHRRRETKASVSEVGAETPFTADHNSLGGGAAQPRGGSGRPDSAEDRSLLVVRTG